MNWRTWRCDARFHRRDLAFYWSCNHAPTTQGNDFFYRKRRGGQGGLPPTTHRCGFSFKKKKAGQGGLPPTSRRRGTICIFVSSFAIMAPYALRNRVCILLRNAENCKGCVIFKFEVHHEMQLQLGLKVRGLGTRY